METKQQQPDAWVNFNASYSCTNEHYERMKQDNCLPNIELKAAWTSPQPQREETEIAIPTSECIENWFAQGKDEHPEYWQEAPFRTNGDVVEEIKTAINYFFKTWQRLPVQQREEKSDAVDFLNWISENKYIESFPFEGFRSWGRVNTQECLDTNQLYSLFLESKRLSTNKK